MKLRRKTIRSLLKSKKAISQVLAAVMMLFLFVAAIALVWAWLYPTYRRFQTQNAINSVSVYMLSFDEGIYDLFGEGVGSTNAFRADPIYGTFLYEEGKNLTFIFSDVTGAFNETFNFNKLGVFTYLMENRQGVMLDVGEHNYLKGPNLQQIFFVNGTSEGTTYQGLTNLTLLRPDSEVMRIELEYRTRIYYWFDQINEILSITVHIMQLDIKGTTFSFHNYQTLKINYNNSQIIYSASGLSNTNFNVYGYITSTPTMISEQPLLFLKPGSVIDYDINIEVILSQFLFYY